MRSSPRRPQQQNPSAEGVLGPGLTFCPVFGVQVDLNRAEFFLVVGSPPEPPPSSRPGGDGRGHCAPTAKQGLGPRPSPSGAGACRTLPVAHLQRLDGRCDQRGGKGSFSPRDQIFNLTLAVVMILQEHTCSCQVNLQRESVFNSIQTGVYTCIFIHIY